MGTGYVRQQDRGSTRLGVDFMMARELSVAQNQVGDVLVFELSGPVDAMTMETFEGALGPVFRSRDARAVVDLSKLTYICSHAMGTLIEYHRQCCLGNGKIVIACSNKSVLKSFERLKADAVLTIVPDRDRAVATIQAG